MFHFNSVLWPMAGALACGAALAQQAPLPSQAEMPSAPAPYSPAFRNYQPYTDEQVGNWKASNDTVQQVGGWRAYARQAQQPAASAPASPASPHSGHPGHGKP